MIARVSSLELPIVAQASSLPVVMQARCLRHNQQHARGFTLIEILASLAVLAVGLTSVVAMVLGSSRISSMAAKRNVATIITTEALAEIQRRHLITSTKYGYSANQVGLLIETLKSPNPNTHDTDTNKQKNLVGEDPTLSLATWNQTLQPPYLSNPPAADNVHTMVWPLGPTPKYFAGAVVAPTNTTGADTDAFLANTAYRVIYRLERHPAWQMHTVDPVTGAVTYSPENPNSPFAGLYLLTLTVYADPTTRCKRLEQISDPVVVYLRDKKPR